MILVARTRKTKHVDVKEQSNSKSQVSAILLFAASILVFCFVVVPGENFWNFIHRFILGLFGVLSVFWSVLLFIVAINTARRKVEKVRFKLYLSISTIVLCCSMLYTFFGCVDISHLGYFEQLKLLFQNGAKNFGSGLFGGALGIPFVWIFGTVGARIIFSIFFFVCIMILTGTTLLGFFSTLKKPVDEVKVMRNTYDERRKEENRQKANIDISLGNGDLPLHPVISKPNESSKPKKKKKVKNEPMSEKYSIDVKLDDKKEESSDDFNISEEALKCDGNYKYPPLGLLQKSEDSGADDVNQELKVGGQTLVETLESFNVKTKIIDISRGPTVTRYELQPASGVKISRITNLADDIALNLAAPGVRIEAPIPGKAAVGIEIPNKTTSVVRMRELIASREFVSAKSRLSVVLGKDISGKVCVTDLAKMPHLLIAGSTGSGKSVCINSFIISLLYKSSPEQVRLLMIDPKVVELGIYNGIPHLLVPVVTDARKAAGALNWAVNEMVKRYKIFAECNVRDITSYNKMISEISDKKCDSKSEDQLKAMPQIVVVIDELADLMMVAPNEVEDAICRLAQMARAAGMHLVIATQRPSVDVITGIIKANIPSRIALAVSSQVDSRTILDMGGAEKLIGRGDMLFSPIGAHKPMRVQGCYVTDKEIESITDYIKNAENADYDESVIEEIEKNAVMDSGKKTNDGSESPKDEMLDDAIKCVVEAGQASTSFLQRKLRVGYARAGRLIDEMESMGVVGPYEGSKPRQVLITYQQWLEKSAMR